MKGKQMLLDWVEEIRALTTPDEVHWFSGSQEEIKSLTDMMVEKGIAERLNEELYPGCTHFRSDASDVARVEDRTFISSKLEEDSGPTNNWEDPVELKKTLTGLFTGSMKGRTLYVIPFSMGPIDSPYSKLGVEITDSPYVVINMAIMTRAGDAALARIEAGEEFVPCLHSVGAPLEEGQEDVAWPCAPMDKKYIAHFPEDRAIWSFGSGYGGNALLGKKCFALRIASIQARDEGWLAEHMLILKLTSPEGKVYHVTGAFPSACGKTNLAMLVPTIEGWKVETVGDDIAWMHYGEDGRLYAINPEAGFFGVAPGTSEKSNPSAMATIQKNTIFTNNATNAKGELWWEGMGVEAPENLVDWKGQPWDPESGEKAAHPNARFTTPASQCPTIAPDWEAPMGVPIDAILVGGRRATTIPLVHESFNWQHGVFMGSIMGSEVTAAVISDKIGQVRRDPFAMLPFIGYHVGDYLKNWLSATEKSSEDKLPRIFYVNWFRKNDEGKFIWPGFGDNSRVLKWITERIDGTAPARKTPIGYVPAFEDLDLTGLDVDEEEIRDILTIDRDEWLEEARSIREHFDGYGEKMPRELYDELDALEERLSED
ncbi:MAG: phosphoenolpyruvate carboxykinase (GTP) [Tissierellia bacterium]|nr:phosphoenolpyruvate carboxykinase (GTP) [Tissierellia bacterium]